jgi:hypothetical protein
MLDTPNRRERQIVVKGGFGITDMDNVCVYIALVP